MTQGRPDEVRQILAPVYDRFTEDFDSPVLRAARTLLAEWVNFHRPAKVNVTPFPGTSLSPSAR